MKKSSDFGAPKPLPGQNGFKATESEVLEKEAKDMEARLKLLQERMLQQRLEDEAVPKPGGARWKSARNDKGSILSYGKDLQEKYKKKRESEGGGDPVVKAAAQIQAKKTMAKSVAGDYRTKDIGNWNVKDVSDWFAFIGLEQYAASFAANEISGPILLDISLEDLDYMGITVLGHRKTILRGIEDLRKNKSKVFAGERTHSEPNVTQPMFQNGQQANVAAATSLSNEISKNKLMSQSMEALSSQKKLKHWSHVEPLSSNSVEYPEGMTSGVNGADDDVLDEEAERKAFQEAVLEWRKASGSSRNDSSSTIAIERDGRIIRPSSSSSTASSSSVQKVGTVTMNDDDDDIDNYQNNSSDSGISKSGMWSNPFEPSLNTAGRSVKPESSPRKILGIASAVPSPPRNIHGNSTSLAHGDLDEEAEHIEFRKAVEAWRSQGSNSSAVSMTTSTGENTSHTNLSGKQIAEKIAKQLEEQQQITIMNLQRRKEIESRKLAQANELLKQQRKSPQDITMQIQSLKIQDIDDELSQDMQLSPRLSMSDDDADMNSNDDHASRSVNAQFTSSCRIEKDMIESILGLPPRDMQEESGYFVEEASDEDN